MRLTVLEEGCEGKLDETFATLLFNAQNPRKPISLIDKTDPNPDLKPLARIFGSKAKIRCPSSLFGRRVTNYLISAKYKYHYLKNYLS